MVTRLLDDPKALEELVADALALSKIMGPEAHDSSLLRAYGAHGLNGKQ